jgi:ABC-type taurine transport system substrate-binding protein
VRNDSGINKLDDFHGKRVASPQFGNTQDVALRNWLKNHGMKTNDKGGDVQIIPMANPDQLTLFLRKDLDAAWAPEPWATRLIHEGNGRLFVDERTLWPNGQFVIGLLVVNTKFLKAHPDLVKNWIRANVELTDWINDHQPEAKRLLNQQIQRETCRSLTTLCTAHSPSLPNRPSTMDFSAARNLISPASTTSRSSTRFSPKRDERRFNEYELTEFSRSVSDSSRPALPCALR